MNSNTLAIGVNTNAIKKDKKLKLDLGQIKHYDCYEKESHANKCPNNVPKIQSQSW